ncbi:MAG: histidinol-phosphate transaminase, partial [Acidobacteriota bacterium]
MRIPDHIESLVPYHPGPGVREIQKLYGVPQVLELASNENCLGASPLAVEAVREYLRQSHRYSNGGWDLRRALAGRFGCSVENVIVGAGSEAILLYVLRALLCDDEEVLTTEGAFIGFQILARSCGANYRTVPYREWAYDLAAGAA